MLSTTRARVIPIAEPTISPVKIRGRLYRVMTWTRAQWEALPRAERPKTAWWHDDDIVMDVRPA